MATGVQTWSGTPVSNATADSNINWAEGMAPSQVNDSARALMASVAKWRDDSNGTLVTSGTTTAFTVTTNQVESALTAGYTVTLQFGATNDNNATLAVDGLAAKPLQTVAGTNAPYNSFQAGSIWRFTYSTTGTGQWIANGGSASTANPVLTTLSASLGADVALNNTGTYFDGPSVAQGTAGVWYASGTVSVVDTAAAATFHAKLWDGTTVIDTAVHTTPGGAGFFGSITLVGTITSPAGNLRISVKDISSAAGKILFNQTGLSKDSSITAQRIG